MARRPTWGPRDQVLWQIASLGGPVTVGTIADEDGPSLGSGSYPSWSPNGNFVLLKKPTGRRGCNDSLAIYDARTAERVRRLVSGRDGSGQCFVPQAGDWSPDGKRIVFARTRNGRQEMWVMRKDGSRKRFLRAYGRNPIWSPDGRLIAYIRNRYPPADLYSDLYVMRADGSRPRRIARDVEYIAWQPKPRS